MNIEQALTVIKAALDESTRKGIFQNMEQSLQTINAYNVLANALLSKPADNTGDAKDETKKD